MSDNKHISEALAYSRTPGDTDVGISYWWQTSTRGRTFINTIFITSIIWLPAGLLLVLGLWTGDIAAMFAKWYPAGSIWLGTLIVSFFAARVIEEHRAVNAAGRRQREIDGIEQAQLTERTKGDKSEELVAKIVQEVAPQLDSLCWADRGTIIRYPDARPDQMSKFEVDNLLVSRFGIFVIEVKNWKGRIEISGDNYSVAGTPGLGSKQSPLKQNESKVRVLEGIAKEVFGNRPSVKVHSVAVFTHREANLPLTAPATVLFLSELRYYLRTAYLSALEAGLSPQEDIQRFRNRLTRLHDSRPEAKHDFMLELARKKSDESGYLRMEERKQQLKRFTGLYPRPYWTSPVMYLGIALYLAIGTWTCLPERNPATPSSSGGSNTAVASAASSRPPDKQTFSATKTGQKVNRSQVR